MIIKNILSFLNKLKINNNKEWFEANKKSYLESKSQFEILVNILIGEIVKFDKEISGIQAKDSIFRIYRDVRFSPDKTPYKTNFGAYMVKGGRKSGFAGYYFHIEPDNVFLSGGIYMPAPQVLKAIRDEIYHNFDVFDDIITKPEFKKHFGNIAGSKLKSIPKGYPKDFEGSELLKFKDYYIFEQVNINKIKTEEEFIIMASEVFKLMVPLNGFLNNAIEDAL